jgi:demethylmenaquinone methyltransferase/2-methoxy-6-polyprenyl-1,4-benzoquinol methylase
MFASIAGRYDFLNHLLSANTDKRWRRVVARELEKKLSTDGRKILDVACGTGDLAIELASTLKAEVTAIDFCRPMLDVARPKAAARGMQIEFLEADALDLPFEDGAFDAATIAFGLRNLFSVEKGLRELLRVLKPNGMVAILEMSKPVIPGLRWVFKFYFSTVLPRIGGLVSGSRIAYEYLPDSVTRFPDQERLRSMMGDAGFAQLEYRNLTGGIAALHLGTKPEA